MIDQRWKNSKENRLFVCVEKRSSTLPAALHLPPHPPHLYLFLYIFSCSVAFISLALLWESFTSETCIGSHSDTVFPWLEEAQWFVWGKLQYLDLCVHDTCRYWNRFYLMRRAAPFVLQHICIVEKFTFRFVIIFLHRRVSSSSSDLCQYRQVKKWNILPWFISPETSCCRCTNKERRGIDALEKIQLYKLHFDLFTFGSDFVWMNSASMAMDSPWTAQQSIFKLLWLIWHHIARSLPSCYDRQTWISWKPQLI